MSIEQMDTESEINDEKSVHLNQITYLCYGAEKLVTFLESNELKQIKLEVEEHDIKSTFVHQATDLCYAEQPFPFDNCNKFEDVNIKIEKDDTVLVSDLHSEEKPPFTFQECRKFDEMGIKIEEHDIKSTLLDQESDLYYTEEKPEFILKEGKESMFGRYVDFYMMHF